MTPEEILEICGYRHGTDQVIIERLNLKTKNSKKPKSVGKFVIHKQDTGNPIVDRRSPNVDLLELPEYLQYDALGYHKDHRGITK